MWRSTGLRQACRSLRQAVAEAGGPRRASAGACSTTGRDLVCTAMVSGGWSGKIVSGLLLVAGSAAMAPVAFAGSVDERSFIMLKPDAVNRGLPWAILQRFESKGYKLVGIKVLVPSPELAENHYAEHKGKPFFPGLVKFLSSGPVIATIWEGKDVIKTSRGLIGATNPLASSPGTIRGDYAIDVGRNTIHGSDSTESAQKEIALWFRPEELAHYEKTGKGWIYESAV